MRFALLRHWARTQSWSKSTSRVHIGWSPFTRQIVTCSAFGDKAAFMYIVVQALSFGLHSAPKLFMTVADAIGWILAQSSAPLLFHYLHDSSFSHHHHPLGRAVCWLLSWTCLTFWKWISDFKVEMHNHDGQLYPPRSIHCIVCEI